MRPCRAWWLRLPLFGLTPGVRTLHSFRAAAALLAVGVILGLVLTEVSVRLFKWTPRTQIVRGFGLHAVEGVPVWEQTADRHNRACVDQHPERTRILFFGSSITYGVGLSAREAFTVGLQDALNAAQPTPGFCVLNFAQPGFAFEQKFVVAKQEVPRYRPALIMWENWVEWRGYRMIGDAAYGVGDLRVRSDGFVGMRYVPDAVNRLLFRHSRLYEYLTLALGEQVEQRPSDRELPGWFDRNLAGVTSLAASVNARLLFYLAPPLDRPFAETAAKPPDWHGLVVDFATRHGVAVYQLQRELIDQEYLALRLDPCCHFNAAGHRALVPIMRRLVLDQLGARPARIVAHLEPLAAVSDAEARELGDELCSEALGVVQAALRKAPEFDRPEIATNGSTGSPSRAATIRSLARPSPKGLTARAIASCSASSSSTRSSPSTMRSRSVPRSRAVPASTPSDAR